MDPEVRIDAVGCETGFPVDDVGVSLTNGGFILVQAKSGMRRLDPRAADLRSAVDQLVHAMISGLDVNGIAVRPVDVTRDRLVIATSHDSSQSFHVLGRVCGRLRDHPPSAPVLGAGVTEDGRNALEALLAVVETAWTAAAGRGPTDEELRRFLRVVEVSRFDFEPVRERTASVARGCSSTPRLPSHSPHWWGSAWRPRGPGLGGDGRR